MSELNLAVIPPLVGDGAAALNDQVYSIINNTTRSPYLVGPSGSGKTHHALVAAKRYSEEHDVPAFFVQLSPDQTKTSVIGGHRLVGGTMKSVKGVFAQAMVAAEGLGGIVVVDETTHATQELQLMFNSALDRTSVTTVGDDTIMSGPSFRAIFCANDSLYAGNARLAQSFAQRLIAVPFGYPSVEDETKIALSIAEAECSITDDVAPDSVARYIVQVAQIARGDTFPISARNVSAALMLLTLAPKDESVSIDDYFVNGANVEATRRTLAERLLDDEIKSTIDLSDPLIVNFVKYVSRVGIENFRRIVLQAFMYYLDIDGTELVREETREKLAASVI